MNTHRSMICTIAWKDNIDWSQGNDRAVPSTANFKKAGLIWLRFLVKAVFAIFHCLTCIILHCVRTGFVNTRHCTLVNTSLIPMTFNLRVPADGISNDDSHSRDSLIDSNISDVGSTIMPSPKEFDITPSSGIIAPQGTMDIKVSW